MTESQVKTSESKTPVRCLGSCLETQIRGLFEREKAKDIFDAVYASGRLRLPLEGALLIGY